MNNIIYLFGTLLNAGIPFLFLPILSRLLTPNQYGEMNLFITLYSLAVPLISIGIPGYLYLRYFDEKQLPLQLLKRCFFIVGLWFLFVFLICISVNGILEETLSSISENIHFYAPLLLVAALFNAIFTSRLQLFTAMNKPVKFLSFQILYTSILFIITLFLLFKFDMNFDSRIRAIIITDIAFGIISVYLLGKLVKISKNEIKPQEGKDFLLFGFGILPHLLAAVLLSVVDKLVISYYMSMENLAVYAIAVQYTSILMIFMQGVSKEWNRTFLLNPYAKEINRKAIKYILAIISVGIILFLSKDMFYLLFVGENLRKGFDIVNILLLSQLFHCLYMLAAVQITYNKKTHVLSSLTVLSLILNIIFSLYWVEEHGLVGVAYATLLGMFSKFFLVSLYVFKLRYSYYLLGSN